MVTRKREVDPLAGAQTPVLPSHRGATTIQLGRLSSGAAAELADVPRPLFLARLADDGVATFDLTADELAHDFANA